MATIQVPADQSTIQAAINAASSGDIINIAAGTYQEELDDSVGNITLQGATGNPEDVIIISSGSTTTAHTIDIGADSTIKNLTVYYSGSASSANVNNAPLAVKGRGGYVKFHMDNCRVLTLKGGIGYLSQGSTINRVWFESMYKSSSGTSNKTWAMYPMASRGGSDPGVIVTSCASIDMNWADFWSLEGPIINTTISTQYNLNDGARRLIYADEVVNCIANIKRPASNDIHSGIVSENSSIIHNNIVHGGSTAAKDMPSGGTQVNNVKHDDVTFPLFVNESGSILNVNSTMGQGHNIRVVSGSQAYRGGTGSYQALGTASFGLDGKPFNVSNPTIGCFAYSFAHNLAGVNQNQVSGALGLGLTSIKSILGVET